MVRKAAGYIARRGPSTPEDRWEEDAGLTAYSLACMIAALLVAAEMADGNNEPKLAAYLRETADTWNGSIESWTYVEQTPLARMVGVGGYYVRIAPPRQLTGETPLSEAKIRIPNLPAEDSHFFAADIVSVDTLALVRFGLRAADDPRIKNTVRVIDAVLKVETPHGPCWHRYNHDGYGEHEDGSPFDGTGVGRAWPLFVGERAHYELAAKKPGEAQRLLGVMEALAGDTGLISEQVWDSAPIPAKELFPGRPSGSARPLVWAHAEYVKLLRSLTDGKVFDTPPQTVKRYLLDKTQSRHCAVAAGRADPPGCRRQNAARRDVRAGNCALECRQLEIDGKSRRRGHGHRPVRGRSADEIAGARHARRVYAGIQRRPKTGTESIRGEGHEGSALTGERSHENRSGGSAAECCHVSRADRRARVRWDTPVGSYRCYCRACHGG